MLFRLTTLRSIKPTSSRRWIPLPINFQGEKLLFWVFFALRLIRMQTAPPASVSSFEIALIDEINWSAWIWETFRPLFTNGFYALFAKMDRWDKSKRLGEEFFLVLFCSGCHLRMATLQNLARRKWRAAGASCLWTRGREVVRWENAPLGLSGSPVCRQTVQHPV